MKRAITLASITILAFAVGFVGLVGIANATPLYAPGQTLDPNCLPTNPDCTVTAPAASGVNSDITQLSALTAATSTNFTVNNLFQALTGWFTNLVAVNATSTNFFATTASSTNLFSSSANLASAIFGNATTTNATTTNLYAGSSLGLNGQYIHSWSDLSPLVGSSSSAFSTTSADYWKTQRDFFSTSSTDYLLNSFGPGFLYNLNGTTVATTSPSFGYITATSTTATSTFAGGIVGPNNFTVQQGTGFVGIGTANPSQELTISGSDANTTLNAAGGVALALINTNTTANNYADLTLRTADTNGTVNTGAKISAVFLNHTPGGISSDLAFLTRNAGTLAENMRLTAAGNLGIGTTSPYSTLSVNGQVVGANFIATTSTASVFPDASTTQLTISKLFDSTNSLGANGSILQTNGSTATWVATSSLNFIANLNNATGTLPISNGGTGATTTLGALTNLGLSYLATSSIPNYNLAAWGDSLTGNSNGLGYQLTQYLPTYNIYNGGVPGDTSTGIATRMLAATDKYGYVTVIWAGYNDHNAPSTVEANITSMVNALTTSKFVVLTVLNGSSAGESIGGTDYNNIISINNWILSQYPNNSIDIRSYLVSQYNPNLPQDVIDYSNDIVPTSLRADTIHLTTPGYILVVNKVINFITTQLQIPKPLTFLDLSQMSLPRVSMSLASDTTGDILNTALGYESGYGATSSPDQRSVIDTGMLFLGYQASRDGSVVASTTALKNATAIGYGAKVGTSSAIVLGGTYPNGNPVNVGIGTTTPATTFQVWGYGNAVANTFNVDTNTATTSNRTLTINGNRINTYNTGNNGPTDLILQNFYTSGGNVYIGTTSQGTLSIGTTTKSTQFSIWGPGGTTGIGFQVDTGTTNTSNRILTINGSRINVTQMNSPSAAALILQNNGGMVGIGTTTPFALLSVAGVANGNTPLFAISTSTASATTTVFQIDKNGVLTMNTLGATSTINGNLYVNGTLRSTTSYNGDLVFANNFRFTEAPLDGTPQGLLVKNQNNQQVLSIDENGNLTTTGDICANTTNCFSNFNTSLASLSSEVNAMASISSTTATSTDWTAAIADLNLRLDALSSTTDVLSSTTALIQSNQTSTSTIASSTALTLSSSSSFIQTIASAVQNLIQSAGNWIVNQVTAVTGIFTTVHTDTLCVGSTCVTEAQLQQLLQKENVAAAVQTTQIVTTTVTATSTATSTSATSTATSTLTNDASSTTTMATSTPTVLTSTPSSMTSTSTDDQSPSTTSSSTSSTSDSNAPSSLDSSSSQIIPSTPPPSDASTTSQ